MLLLGTIYVCLFVVVKQYNLVKVKNAYNSFDKFSGRVAVHKL